MTETLVSAARKGGITLITLGATLDARCSEDLKKKLSTLLRRKPPLAIDGRQVDRVDTAGLQVLLAFVNEARSRDIDIGWHETSDSLKTASRLTGLLDQLGIAV
jgi:anti-anti-sigma factor